MTESDDPTLPPLDIFSCPLDGSTLVEASAGTGKTWALCGLYLRLLLERGLEVPQILVVTFTNAATAELRERIRSRIVQVLGQLRADMAHTPPIEGTAADPFVERLLHTLRSTHGLADDTLLQRLDLALQTFDEASIFTIHGFCHRALGDAPFSAGMPMALELLPDDSALRLQVVHDFWRRRITGSTLSPTLAAALARRRDSPVSHTRLLQQRVAKPLARQRWPDDLDATGAPDLTVLADAHAAARARWQAERDDIVAVVNEALPRLNGTYYKPALLAIAIESWDALLSDADPATGPLGLERLDLFGSRRLQPRRGEAPPRPHAFFDEAQTLLDQRTASDSIADNERLRLLRDLLAEGPLALRQAKQARRVLGFDDMLFNLHERLTRADCAPLLAALRQRFPAALVDEFQDTDPLQWSIFQRLYGGAGGGHAPLFLVGDPKQAIYSFRHADLHTYLQARAQATHRATLADNQRSSPALVAALNAFFSANPRAFVQEGLHYQPVAVGVKPRPPLQDHSQARAALQLWSLPPHAEGRALRKAEALQAAAAACAGEVARLLTAAARGEVHFNGRLLAAGDMAVLVRSHAQGARMRQALFRLGVGSVELSQASLFDSSDAEELERVLVAMLDPARPGTLRAALATRWLGLDASEIAAVSADETLLAQHMQRLAEHRHRWLQRGVGVMLRRWMADEGVSDRLLAAPDGERRLTNLLHLIECLQEAAPEHAAPPALLRWLQRQRSASAPGRDHDEATQLRLESDRHLVQIVTIHKSKGLEYPFVFCPFLWDGHPGGIVGGPEGREYHDLLDGSAVVDFRRLDEKAPEAVAIKQQRALDKFAENLRLVYVALTRAVHRCHVVVGPYVSGASDSATESSRSPLHWLVDGQGVTPQAWLKAPAAPDARAAAWQAFAERNVGAVGLAPLPVGPFAPLPAAGAAANAFAALPGPLHIPAPWWVGSYSSLTQGARHESAAADHDLRLREVPPSGPPTAPPAADDILRFPRGAAAGVCLHAVFEQARFDQPDTWPATVAAVLQAHPLAAAADAPAPPLPAMQPMVLRALHDVLHTPLRTQNQPAFRLADLVPGRKLVELEFMLPAAHLSAPALAAVLQQHGYVMPTLAFGTLQGYLRGFIDLVFEHGGRFHIVDWKSNHLGDTAADYARAALQTTMDAQGYHLQYLLYGVALHRWLQQRLAGYNHAQHMGDVLYLFVRGVRPDWRDAHGVPCGVFAHRPPLAVIEQISALLGGA